MEQRLERVILGTDPGDGDASMMAWQSPCPGPLMGFFALARAHASSQRGDLVARHMLAVLCACILSALSSFEEKVADEAPTFRLHCALLHATRDHQRAMRENVISGLLALLLIDEIAYLMTCGNDVIYHYRRYDGVLSLCCPASSAEGKERLALPLSSSGTEQINMACQRVVPGDVLLLASHALWEKLSEAHIKQLVACSAFPHQLATMLSTAARNQGAQSTGVMVIDVL